MFNPNAPRRLNERVPWRRILALFAPYRREMLLLFGCIVVIALLGLLPPLFTKWLIDDAITHHDLTRVTYNTIGMIVAALLSGGIGIYQGYLNSVMGEGIICDLRTALVGHLQEMSIAFFTSTKAGAILNRVSNDVESLDTVVTGTLSTILTNMMTMLTTVVTILILDWRLALVAFAAIPLMIAPLSPVGRRMYDIRRKTREQRDTLESLTQETLSLSGILLIKAFGRERFERQRFRIVAEQLQRLEIQLAMVGRWFIGAINAMVVLGPALVWFAGAWLVIHGGLTIGTIVAFVAYLGRLYTPASALAGIQVQIVSAVAVFERLLEYLDLPQEMPEASNPIKIDHVEGEVRFESVTFGYTPEHPILHDLSFTVQPGAMVAFVGASGAGKTSIGTLIPRFYDVDAGVIRLDGHDIREIRLAELREHIGIVSQETYLFHDTIARNLRYGREEASDDELIAAAKAANIHDVIMRLPDRYETLVGERGHKLSGGERQRLAIARVLLKNPRILILDEATSALDSHTEALIQAELLALMQGRTSIVIAHRLSTIVQADEIFVVDQGRIIESGRHAELLAREGRYAALYREQYRDTSRENDTPGNRAMTSPS